MFVLIKYRQSKHTKLKNLCNKSKNVFTFDIAMAKAILTRAQAKEFKLLLCKKERDKSGLFLAEGEKCVLDSLKGFKLHKLIGSSEWLISHPEIEERYREKILVSDKRGIEIISSLTSLPEVIAVLEKPQTRDFISGLEITKWYVLLDEIQDPGNLGTIIRTCDWFGVYDIYASKNTADVYSPKVVQATMGSLSRVRVNYVNLDELISDNPDLPVVGAMLEGLSVREMKFGKGGFLLMGNEGRGVSEELRRKITQPITIPPVNEEYHPDSLNVAIATSIILSRIKE